jgi:hypothetical protein
MKKIMIAAVAALPMVACGMAMPAHATTVCSLSKDSPTRDIAECAAFLEGHVTNAEERMVDIERLELALTRLEVMENDPRKKAFDASTQAVVPVKVSVNATQTTAVLDGSASFRAAGEQVGMFCKHIKGGSICQ